MGTPSILEGRTLYEILNVAQGATADEIRAAYKEIAKIYHPDSNFYAEIIQTEMSPEAIATFKQITAAYNTLINDEHRAEYDRTLLKGTLPSWESGPAQPDYQSHLKPSVRPQGPFVRRTHFGQAPRSDFEDVIAQDPSVLHAFRQNAHRAFALHLGLGIGAGVLVGLILLFAMGII